MFDIAWSELALIAAVALIVIGPKDLPRVMRTAGQWIRRARGMAAEFQRNFDDMMREAELHELKREVENVSPTAFKQKIEEMIDVKSIEAQMTLTPTPSPAPEAAEPTPSETPPPEIALMSAAPAITEAAAPPPAETLP